MDTRLLILVGAAALLLLALVYLIETLVASSRAKREIAVLGHAAQTLAGQVDPQPSASLETPLVLGDWTAVAGRIPEVPSEVVARTSPAAVPLRPREESPSPAPQSVPEPAPAHIIESVERSLSGETVLLLEAPPEPVSLEAVLAGLELRAAQARSRTIDAPEELLLPEHLKVQPSTTRAPEPARESLEASPPVPVPVVAPVVESVPVAPVAEIIAVTTPVAEPALLTPPAPIVPAAERPGAVAHPIPDLAAVRAPSASRHIAASSETPRDYAMVAAVELQFDDEGPRVGIRSGTRAYLEFQRIADVLWADLDRSRAGR